MKRFVLMWRGELALDDAFWNWAVFGGLIVNVTSSAAFLFLIVADRHAAAAIVGYVFSVPYNIAVVVGVWRSAARFDGDQRRADLARIATLVGMVIFSVT